MPVKISRLFKDSRFLNLSERTRLLYIYLATNPNLEVVGVLCPNLKVITAEVGCTMEQLRESTKSLMTNKYIYVKEYDNNIYFILPDHFNTVPKSESSVLKVQKSLSSLPTALVKFLKTIGICVKSKIKVFTEPTVDEVSKYALSQGYLLNGEDFINYYQQQSERYGKKGVWVDSRGKQINDWKAKLRRIWCKDENKLKPIKDAPKGFEFFYVIKDSKIVQPEGWRGGKPYASSLSMDLLLKKEYDFKTNS